MNSRFDGKIGFFGGAPPTYRLPYPPLPTVPPTLTGPARVIATLRFLRRLSVNIPPAPLVLSGHAASFTPY